MIMLTRSSERIFNVMRYACMYILFMQCIHIFWYIYYTYIAIFILHISLYLYHFYRIIDRREKEVMPSHTTPTCSYTAYIYVLI